MALWVEAAPGSQAYYTQMEPEHFFVPPYVGCKGWLGIELNRDLSWQTIAARVAEAYEKVAPTRLLAELGETIAIEGKVVDLSPEEIDPLLGEQPQRVLTRLAKFCEALPETTTSKQFGNPVWKAGSKTFVCVHKYEQRLTVQAWVGVDQQGFLTMDPRYRIPAYVGHNGWIDLDIEEEINWSEIESLVMNSYRHFALKRMLKLLD